MSVPPRKRTFAEVATKTARVLRRVSETTELAAELLEVLSGKEAREIVINTWAANASCSCPRCVAQRGQPS